jgi:prepilin-type N-terminal cleavage/methylation domain-containing protein
VIGVGDIMNHRRSRRNVRWFGAIRRDSRRCGGRSAFTLIELVVVLVIISILGSLTLGGLAVTRQRAKIDKTKSTIRKIHELVVPHYESYVRRRVPMSGSSGPQARLLRTRQLLMFEMPDSWEDVAISPISPGTLPSTSTVPPYAWNGVTRSYAAYHASMLAGPLGVGFRTNYPSSECLYMIVSLGLGEPDVMEQFRSDEIGDVDEDGAPEFVDGWGQPIAFIRWPVGFQSAIQSRDAAVQPDPFDPYRVSTQVAYPNLATPQRDYAVTPLVISWGPDGELPPNYSIALGGPWSPALLGGSPSLTLRIGHTSPTTIAGAIKDISAAADNVTNHDLLSK